MAQERAAIRYAKAVLNLASSKHDAEAVNTDMTHIANAFTESKELSTVFQSPIVKSEDKKAIFQKVFQNTNAITTSLISNLITNKRIGLLCEVAKQYLKLYQNLNQIQTVKVTTAVPLNTELQTKVLAKVKELTGKTKVEVINEIDTNIIGGFILRIDDLQYNASIANQLNNLKQELLVN